MSPPPRQLDMRGPAPAGRHGGESAVASYVPKAGGRPGDGFGGTLDGC